MKPTNALALVVPSDLSFASLLAAVEQLRGSGVAIPDHIDAAIEVWDAGEIVYGEAMVEHLRAIKREGDPLTLFRELTCTENKHYELLEWSVTFKTTDGRVLGQVWSGGYDDDDDTSKRGVALEADIVRIARTVTAGKVASVIVKVTNDAAREAATDLALRWSSGDRNFGDDAYRFTERPHLKIITANEIAIVLSATDGKVLASEQF